MNHHPSLPFPQRSHEEERDEVKREYDRFPKKEELEHHRREIQRQAEELSDEISMVRGWTWGGGGNGKS